MNRTWSSRCKCAVALLLVGMLGACASPSPIDGPRGSLVVVGSGTQTGAINAWRAAWVDDNNGVSVNFSPDGPDVGIRALVAGTTYVATTDAPLDAVTAESATETCGPSGAVSLPTAITPVGVAYNLSGLRDLVLDAPTLAAIFNGSIQKWDDPRVQLLNPTVDLPSADIIPVTSTVESALNMTASSYLSADSAGVWNSAPERKWPAFVAGTKVDKDGNIAQEVDDHFGTIAFMSLSDIGKRFETSALKFNGKFASPDLESINTAIAESGFSSSSSGVKVNLDSEAVSGYNLLTVSYQVFCSSYKNETIATMVRSWVEFIVSDIGQKKAEINAGIFSPNEAALVAARSFASAINGAR